MSLVIKWGRIGQTHLSDFTDSVYVTDLVNLADLESRIKSHVAHHLAGDFNVEIEVTVKLAGGAHKTLPFGYGKVLQVDGE